MRGAPIPERAPLNDAFSGFLLRAGSAAALSASDHEGAQLIASGSFAIRYGVRFLGKPEQYIVPGLVVLDYGDMLSGEEAWSFLWHRSNLHPRAEVVGSRDDGSEDIVFFRTLDFSLKPGVLVYDDPSAAAPLAQASALVAAESAGLPPRLLEYLPCYPTITDWLAAL